MHTTLKNSPLNALSTLLMVGSISLLQAEPSESRKEAPVTEKRAADIQKALLKVDPSIRTNHYELKSSDLDADGVQDALVLMNGKSGYCGSGGCSLFVFLWTKGQWKKVGDMSVVSRPIYVRTSQHHGMHDLVVSVRGGGVTPGTKVFEFNEESYEESTSHSSDHLLFPESIIDDSPPLKEAHPKKPAKTSLKQLKLEDLAGIEELSKKRREIIALALKVGRENPNNHYLFGSADFKRGGVDCSGAMYNILRQLNVSVPRSSATQYDWVQKSGNLVKVSEKVSSLDDPVFDALKPGDLLFWSHTYHATDGRKNGITHVQMYLGKEKKDGRRVMIGSSNGRSYRGVRQDGYAVFDFKLPHQGSTQKFAGFGSPLSE